MTGRLERLIAKRIALRVRTLRKDRGLTQYQLAARAGGSIQRPHITRLERGRHAPNVLTLELIARGLGLDLRSLLLGLDWQSIDRVARATTLRPGRAPAVQQQ